MIKTLKLVITDHWFEEIKSGRKTHEYRKVSKYWLSRLGLLPAQFFDYVDVKDVTRIGNEYSLRFKLVEFKKAYHKNPERITFEIKKVVVRDGKDTDLHIEGNVFDIELGERIK